MDAAIKQLLDAIVGPQGALVATSAALWAFFTRRVRPGADVVALEQVIREKDARIEVLLNDSHAEQLRAVRAEQALAYAEAEVARLRDLVGEKEGPPLV